MRSGKLCAVAVAAFAACFTGSAWAGEGKSGGDFMVRARAIDVRPDVGSRIGTIGGTVEISHEYAPELDFSYFITDYIALELIAATTNHSVKAKGTALGDVDLGSVSLLPPTLTLQYHPLPKAQFSPYVGAGLNYTMFFDNKPASSTATVNQIEYDDHIGYALQAGLDYNISGNWYANLDVKKLYLRTGVDMNNKALHAQVDINPWIVGVGVGYKF